ncbi:TIGR02678 family protein [Actinoplanes sp. RD1]|uniref:TIGR02678 family protein n=1 Tax=Actinoplanes sp. RD1 TaxID=3064538 RepID=UPI0027412AA8|nr:TIGR02678 family protein [Actinoplanes sp. RD1]
MSTSADTRDAQRAFLGLLETPMITPATDPALHRLVLRHLRAVTESAGRLGYRVQRVGRTIRLIRVPIAGGVTAPPRPSAAPDRRILALTCCLAACCEEIAGPVTLQRLSDLVRDLSATAGVRIQPYDPEDRPQRKLLRAAASVLESWGVLRRRTSDEHLLDEWTERGNGPGAGYDVDRDALLLMTSPDVLAAALTPDEDTPEQRAATRTLRQLRSLTETPAVLYADLDPDDAEAWRAARGPRAGDVARMTGGQVEARAEGLVLVLTGDETPATVADWPRARAADWVALLMADGAGQHGTRQPDGTVTLTDAQVEEVVADLVEWRGDYLNKAQREVPGALRAGAEEQLTELGLLRTHPGGSWTLLPVAGRYRAPGVTITDATEA